MTLKDPRDALLERLSPAQRDAASHVQGPMLILAGPGSGKTRVITHRIAYLLHEGVRDREILALTFTNKAAEEMNHRLRALVPNSRVWMGTFHRFCARLLREYARFVGLKENYSIYDVEDAHKILKTAVEQAGDYHYFSVDQIAGGISWAKNALMRPQDYQARKGHPLGQVVADVYPRYQQLLLEANAVDFDDLLLHSAYLMREHDPVRRQLDERYKFVMVDEYQDTNLAQYAIARGLSITYPNLAVTGDPDQSIYGWRGATIRNILEFEKDFPSVRVVRLEQNYRSSKAILRVADELIAHNVKRKKKSLWTENAEGVPVALTTYPSHADEAEQIARKIGQFVQEGRSPAEFAIFYRTNALSRTLEKSLYERGIPYQIVRGLEFYQRKEIKDVIGYLKLIANPDDRVAFLRVVNVPTRGVGKATTDRLQDFAQKNRLPLLAAARDEGWLATLNKRSANAVRKFNEVMVALSRPREIGMEDLIRDAIELSGYREALLASGSEEDHERVANIEELCSAAREFDDRFPGDNTLERFLEQTALVSDTDAFEGASEKVTLMTLHAAKGLEFPTVFIVAVEEGILPHERSREDADQLEEERRLLFVGITRAMKELHLSMAQYRTFRGRNYPTIPSQFLMELPRQEMTLQEPSLSAYQQWGGWGEASSDADPYGDDIYDQRIRTNSPGRLNGAAKAGDPGDAPVVDDGSFEPAPEEFGEAPHDAGDFDAMDEPPGRVAPESFRLGMTVEHPSYGLGRISSLSGRGPKTTAVVRFDDASERTFRIAFSPLKPYAG